MPDRVLAPGFIDIQVNGIDDVDCATADGTDWERLDALLLAQGVTSWCPTLVTMPLSRFAAPLERIDAAMHRSARRSADASSGRTSKARSSVGRRARTGRR